MAYQWEVVGIRGGVRSVCATFPEYDAPRHAQARAYYAASFEEDHGYDTVEVTRVPVPGDRPVMDS